MDLPTGKIKNLSESDYHNSPAYSHSKLNLIRKSPMLAQKVFTGETEIPATKDILIGRALHALFLEGVDKFNDRYCVVPEDAPKRPKYEDPEGRQVLTRMQYDLVKEMHDGLSRNEEISRLLYPGFESEVTWRLKLTSEIYLQCRTDIFIESEDKVLVCDVKTTKTLKRNNPEWCSNFVYDSNEWSSIFLKWGYYRQNALYQDIISQILEKPVNFRFFLVEKEPPYESVVIDLDKAFIDLGAFENKLTIDRLKIYKQRENWEGIDQRKSYRLCLPSWLEKKLDDQRFYA